MSDMTTDQCFNEMAEVLGFPGPHESVGYIAILEQVKKLKEENKTLKKQRDFFHQEFHKTLQCQADDTEEYEKQIKELKEENKTLKDANLSSLLSERALLNQIKELK